MNEEFEDEEFKFVPGYINYSISNQGRVRNNCTGRFLKPFSDGGGYYTVRLSKDGKAKLHTLHRLIAILFVDNPENKMFVDHIDNNRRNNDVLNLRWVSRKENNQNKSMSRRNTSGIKGVSWNKLKKNGEHTSVSMVFKYT